jgi:hypothetical protein
MNSNNNNNNNIDLSNNTLSLLSSSNKKDIIDSTFEYGSLQMTELNLTDSSNQQFINIVSSAMILLSIFKIEMSSNNIELSNYYLYIIYILFIYYYYLLDLGLSFYSMVIDKILNIQDDKGNSNNYTSRMESFNIYIHGINLIHIWKNINGDIWKMLNVLLKLLKDDSLYNINIFEDMYKWLKNSNTIRMYGNDTINSNIEANNKIKNSNLLIEPLLNCKKCYFVTYQHQLLLKQKQQELLKQDQQNEQQKQQQQNEQQKVDIDNSILSNKRRSMEFINNDTPIKKFRDSTLSRVIIDDDDNNNNNNNSNDNIVVPVTTETNTETNTEPDTKNDPAKKN